VKMSLKDIVKLKHNQVDAMAWSFIRGMCFAILSYCVIYTYFFIVK
jgi:hypothetical protein